MASVSSEPGRTRVRMSRHEQRAALLWALTLGTLFIVLG